MPWVCSEHATNAHFRGSAIGFAIVCEFHVIKYLLDIQRLLNDINAYLQNADGVWESIIAFAFLAITTNKMANARILFHIPFTFFFTVYFYVDRP